MYCNHYGFSEKPFNVTPDPRFLFLTPDHRETLAAIVYGIQERRGFVTVIGEVGTGKTTLLNAAVDPMDERTRVAFIFNMDLTFNEMLNMALHEWGLLKDNESVSKVDAIQRLRCFATDQLKNGRNVILIVDEAQNLDPSVIENLRLLSNLETRRHKLIQIVLSGQPELDIKLKQHELRQFAQRISVKRYVSPLDEKHTYAYLRHRLKRVQDADAFPFTPEAQKLVWEYSKGVPRKINILCDNALLIGYALKRKKINGAMVLEAAQDLKWCSSLDVKAPWDLPSPKSTGFTWIDTKPPRRSFKVPAAMAIAGMLLLAGSLFLSSGQFESAKLTRFFSNITGTALETIHPEEAKARVNVLRPDISVQEMTKPRLTGQKVTKEKPESETWKKGRDLSHLTLSNYYLATEISPVLVVQNNETQNSKQVSTFNENDLSENQVKDKEKQDPSAPETRAEAKDKPNLSTPVKTKTKVLKIKIKKGDTLFRIITQKFGGYDGTMLAKVLRKNPGITDPDKILAGQEIRLPADKMGDRIYYR